MSDRPRVLFVGRARYLLPLPGWLAKKWDAVERELDYRILGSAAAGSMPSNERFRLSAPLSPRILDGLVFYLRLPLRVRREIATFRPQAIFASDPIVGAATLAGRSLSRSRPVVIVEVHGDWRTFSRAYGSPARRLVARLVDRIAEYSVRHADATRAVSTFTAGLIEDVRGRPPSATFTAFSDLTAFTDRPVAPLPERPTLLFVGALERYKNVEGLARAWRLLEGSQPEARLVLVGSGSQLGVVEKLVADFPGRVEHHSLLEPAEVARALDESTALVLPSWPEGLGRVVIEAFARGRGVVATDGGGIPDLVADGVEGFLVPPFDTEALAGAVGRVLGDRELAERLGAAAKIRFEDWNTGPDDLAREMRSLVDAAIAGDAR